VAAREHGADATNHIEARQQEVSLGNLAHNSQRRVVDFERIGEPRQSAVGVDVRLAVDERHHHQELQRALTTMGNVMLPSRAMPPRVLATLALSFCASSFAACTRSVPDPKNADPATTASVATDPAPGAIDARFIPDARAAFASYRSWGRVDDELRWAPFKCLLPMPGRPAMSEAPQGDHARKLYSLFAKDRLAYALLGKDGAKAAVRPIIVKESYAPESTKAANIPTPEARLQVLQKGKITDDHFDAFVRDGEVLYRAGALAGIFVMMHVGDATPDNDDGWVYGTLTPRGEITSLGKVASCMECHQRAKYGRLFGVREAMFGLAR